MKALLFVIYISLFSLSAHAGNRIAIFDFDDRLYQEKTVAKYIEKKLLKMNKDLKITQFSGKGKNTVALKVLKKIDNLEFNLIILVTSDALLIAQHLVTKTPVIFTNVNNPLFFGFKDLKKPGGNISGASYYVPIDKQLELFLQIQPKMNKVGGIFDAKNQSSHVEIRETRNAFRKLGLQFIPTIINSENDLQKVTKKLIAKKVDAIIITSSDTIYNNIGKIKLLTNQAQIPIYSFNRKAVESGAVASLSSDYYLMVDQLVIPMVKEVLFQRKNPGTMPIRFIDENILDLNLTSAKALGLTIPEELIKRAKHKY